LDKLTCGTDFLSRVGVDVATKARIDSGVGTVPAPAHAPAQAPAQQPGGVSLEQAIGALAPQQYTEDQIEELVQILTDQIMATA
jgi:hypothetical protein